MANKITQDTLRMFVDDLRSTHGDNLASVVLYGSAAVGDEVEQQFGYNFLVALHAITPHDLRVAQAPIREWLRFGQPLPVYFTLAELKDAADVFPIEFNQMERTRKVYYGVDPFEIMTLSDVNLRHQTEYELRGKLIQLRRSYISASSSANKLSTLMSESLASFASLFRPVLLLMGKEPPVTKLDCRPGHGYSTVPRARARRARAGGRGVSASAGDPGDRRQRIGQDDDHRQARASVPGTGLFGDARRG